MAITQEQREQRRKFLGSSDSPIIMNLSPYSKTPTDIYWSKVSDADDEVAGPWIDSGNWLEGPLVQWAAGELGLEVSTDPEDLFHVAQHGDGRGVLASNLDSIAWDDKCGVEAKFANGEMAQAYGEPGTDQVADHVIVQVQHQMYCAELEKVYVALAVPSYYGVERRLYCVPRDDELISQIVTFGCQWWDKHVKANIPPQPQEAPPMYVLKALHRKTGSQIKLDREHIELADADERLKNELKSLKGQRDSVRAKLIHALGSCEIGLLPDGRKVTYQGHDVSSIDVNALRAKKPEIAAQFTVKKFQRTLYIKKG